MNEIHIKTIDNMKDKSNIIVSCSDGKYVNVISKSDFDIFLKKIDRYAKFIVAYNNIDILGYAAMYANDYLNKIAYISLISVKAKYQNKGVGKMIMAECKKIARELGMKIIRLEVHKDNVRAQRFYENNGFKFGTECSDFSFIMEYQLC